MAISPRLKDVLEMVRPEAEIPVIVEFHEMPTQREIGRAHV